MTRWTLIKRSLRFHWRSHLGVVLGAAIGSAALIGALIVGDSVRESLRERALERLGPTHFAIDSGDRLFVADLPARINNAFGPQPSDWIKMSRGGNSAGAITVPNNLTNHVVNSTALLHVTGTAAKPDATTRANHINVFGIDASFANLAGRPLYSGLAPGDVLLNQALAAQLRLSPGDQVLFRLRKPEAISAESPVSTGDGSVAVRLKVKAIVPDAAVGNLSLRANQVPPHNAFVNLGELQNRVDASNRANLLLTGPVQEHSWQYRKRFVSDLGRRFDLGWSWLRSDIVLRTNVLTGSNTLSRLQDSLQRAITMDDLQLRFRWLTQYTGVEVRSSRIFIEPPISQILAEEASLSGVNTNQRPVQILTYLVNLLRAGTNTTPYSMVSALDSPLLPADLRSDEIVINQWLADDLQAQPGTEIALTYFAPDQVSQLIERTNRFRVRAVIPMTHPLCDRSLMPDFPGVATAERAGDWETSFPLVHKIRPEDDEYWQQYRGTPKAFISLAAGQTIWSSRFGNLTAVRVETGMIADEKAAFERVRQAEQVLRSSLIKALGGPFQMSTLNPLPATAPRLSAASMGFAFTPIREQALNAASQSQDFGGLFIGFSFFLIIAALILMALLFQFGVEQRMTEIGTLLALGFRAKHVRRMFLLEGAALAFIGSVIGVAGGILYARVMLHGLTTIWRTATNTSALSFHASPVAIATGLISGTLVAVFTIWIVLRKQAKQPARELLAGEVGQSAAALDKNLAPSFVRRSFRWLKRPGTVSVIAVISGVALAFSNPMQSEAFFGVGALCLIAGLAATSWMLQRMVGRGGPAAASVDSSILSIRGAARRKSRSVATVALIACGVFLIAAIGAFRLDADANAWKRSSGTGGFALIGESTLPIVKDLNTSAGRDALGLDEKILRGVSFVPFRVREGDDASCLNLNRAQQPRLLGVKPEHLANRKAFTFANRSSWESLDGSLTNAISHSTPHTHPQIPAIGDAASIQWALHKKIGETLAYRDERGGEFDLRLIGGLANSILQGSLIIDEAEFTKRFPSVSGYRMFLIECPSNALPEVSAELSRALQDYGFEVTPAAQRLAAFNAVQNTYLSTFQVLGGLGLLLGSAGLGIVVLRNVLERRGELALLIAVGFRRARVQKLVLAEHAALLGLGLVIGVISAIVAVLPSLFSPRGELPISSLALTLGGVLVFGMISTWLATRVAVRGNLLEGLRNE